MDAVRALFPPVLTCLALLASACGVSLGSTDEGNDFFVSLHISGEERVGEPLTAALAYETFYPMPVDIVCELWRGKELVREIGRTQAPSVPGDLSPEDEDARVPGNIAFDFAVEAAGEFKVECYTPLDDANYILEEFSVRER